MSNDQVLVLDHPKLQFEVRFTHIIASNVIREIVNPFLKLTSSFNIQDQGILEEQIRLNFEEDSFSIICSWDRVILISENNINRFLEEHSSITILFDILRKLSESESFGVFTNYLFNAYVVKIQQDNDGDVLELFRDKFLNSSVIDKIFQSQATDYSVTIDRVDGSKITNIMIGPYTGKDIERYNLYPLRKQNAERIKNKLGNLISVKIFNKSNNIDLSIFKKLIQETNQYCDRV